MKNIIPKKKALAEEVSTFWEREGALKDGRSAYVKSFRSASDADECAHDLLVLCAPQTIPMEQERIEGGYTAIRIDKNEFDALILR